MQKKRTVKYILMLLGLVIFLAGYFLVYMDYAARTDELTAEIGTLTDRLGVLESYNARLNEFQTGIEANKTEIGDVLGSYYSVETPEDFIMLATAMEDAVGVSISSLSFEEPIYISEILAAEDAGDYTAPVTTRTLTGYGVTASMEGAMTYSEMKEVLAYIGSQVDATHLNAVEMSYDATTGLILGSLVIDKYYIEGRDIEEHQINVPYTDIGNDVLIGG